MALVFVLAIGGCSADEPRREAPRDIDHPPPTAPVDADGPDPAVLAVDESYWMFTTSADDLLAPVRHATVNGAWSEPTEALKGPPSWAGRAEVWAPGVIEVNGRYVMWFVSPTIAEVTFSQCIGIAVADTPGGPYEPLGEKPAICGTDGPTIDPFPWRGSDGRLYLAWTQYHFQSGQPTQILASALDESGTQLVGPTEVLLTDPSGWESIILENPALFEQPDGSVRLLYSGNFYFTEDYATGTATCEGPLGPCRRDTPGKAWFASTDAFKGPGGMSVFRAADDRNWAAFHAWGEQVGYDKGGRRAPHVMPLEDLPALPVTAR